MIDLKNTQLQKKFNILLIGDTCLDEYYYGTCDRLNPEAPVPILKITNRQIMLGMAANVKRNLESFNCDVDFMSGGKKSVKKRYIDERSKQHIVRVDEDFISPPFNPNFKSLELSQYDAIVISDYNKGYVTYNNVKELRKNYAGPIFIDTKKQDLQHFAGCFIKINEYENNLKISNSDELIVTLGKKGALYKNKIYPTDTVEVIDVCGAGDTFLAALTYFYLLTLNIEDAIIFANKCAAITVQHRGVYALSTDDLTTILKI